MATVTKIRVEARRRGRLADTDWFDAGLAPMPKVHGERFINQNRNNFTFEYRIVRAIRVLQN